MKSWVRQPFVLVGGMNAVPLTLIRLVFLLSIFSCSKAPITGRSQFIVTSEAQEMKLGDDAYREVLQKNSLSRNEVWSEKIRQVAGRIAKVADKPHFKWEFNLLESKQKNAFCLPGGKVAIYVGMLNSFANDGELAAIVGHEVAHATARHAGERITLQFGTEIGFSALEALLKGGESFEKTILLQSLGLGAMVGAILPFNRKQELEADYIGMIYMARSGYSPNDAVTFWNRFSKETEGGPPELLSTHPPSKHREAELQKHLPEALREYEKSPFRITSFNR